MFVIEQRILSQNVYGPWRRVWTSEDGAETALHLKELELTETHPLTGSRRPGSDKRTEYHMIYDPERKP